MSPPAGPIARTVLAAQSDARLVRLLREGHDPAFEEIVRRYRGPLVGFATTIVGDRAEDVVQAALEKAHRALLADDREINLRPWLFTIVRNGSLNLIRSEPVTDELDPLLLASAGTGPEEAAERHEEMDRLITAICALPVAQREALVRRELEGVGHGEIASQLGTTSTAVRGLIFRARTQLRNAMGALVPLPVLRALLAQGSAIGAAGGAGAAGGGAALLGGAGAKGAAAIAAAVVALGAGIAVEQRHRGNHDGDVAVAEAAEKGSGPAGGGSDGTRSGATSAAAAGDAGSAHESSDAGGGSDHSPGSGDPGGHSGPGGSGGSSGSGTSGSGGSSSGSGSGDSGSGSGSGHSGPGSGHDDSGTDYEPPEQPEQEDNSGSSHEGSGSDGHGSSSYEEPEDPEPPEVEEPDHESSGPGGGSDDGGESSDD
ncbi:MAG: sigma-70 family RNA polymerase sigma factor [Solirubrobacterales bacterium]